MVAGCPRLYTQAQVRAGLELKQSSCCKWNMPPGSIIHIAITIIFSES
jgi:hypothetical protein